MENSTSRSKVVCKLYANEVLKYRYPTPLPEQKAIAELSSLDIKSTSDKQNKTLRIADAYFRNGLLKMQVVSGKLEN